MKISIIGAGNVGWHLANRLFEKGHDIDTVYSRNIKNAIALAARVRTKAIDKLEEIKTDSDLYIFAISDNALAEVAEQLPELKNNLVVHTSGATPSSVFKDHFSRYGVFYPLQTFTKEKKVDFDALPLCLYCNNNADFITIKHIGKSICHNIYEVDDKQRSLLHVAAVFVNNFTNYLYTIGEDILQNEKIDFNILKPLILETAQKIQAHPPAQMQTGPAIRRDSKTIQQHLELLEDNPKYKEIYQMMTQQILAL